ncbi:MAG: VWA domain-containing protein [Ignavibacteria bacterium]
MFKNITFAYPWVLYFLSVIPLMAFWFWKWGGNKSAEIRYSSLNVFKGFPPTMLERFRYLPVILRLLALAFLIIGLARPQTFSSGENIYTQGIDISIALDISGSMLAEDFRPNRIEAAKKVIDDFIQGRTSDRIGLVIFSYESFTQCPLTIDYSVLRGLLKEIKSGMIQDGTAIGTAIANGVNRLKESKSASKVIILLTDGINNAGAIDPLTATQIAKTFGIRIYAIGVGTIGETPYPFQTPFGIRYQNIPVEIDEAMLRKVADMTNGRYFRATGNKKLEDIYNEIDRMEKTKIEVASYRNAKELFYIWAGLGLFLFFAEVVLARTFFRKLP